MVTTFSAPYTPVEGVLPALREHGYAVLEPAATAALCDEPLPALASLGSAWDDLRPDTYLKDGGSYRRRRHSVMESD